MDDEHFSSECQFIDVKLISLKELRKDIEELECSCGIIL